MPLEIILNCPLCGKEVHQPFLTCTDFTTTKEKFELKKCMNCSFIITSPRPDEASINRYYESESYISHTGKSSALFDSLYLFVRSFTLKWKINLIRQIQTPKTILDYGCGTGGFLNACADSGWKSSGVEPSTTAYKKATARPELTIYKTLHEFKNQQFDVITLWHVLEHVADLRQKLIELKSHLKENGTLFVAVPNYQSYDAQIYNEYWAAYDVPRHFWHFSKATMTRIANEAGLTLLATKPMKLDAYYVCLLSEKYKNGSHTITGIFTALINATRSNIRAKKEMNYSSLIYILK